jgi:hypothetical protein
LASIPAAEFHLGKTKSLCRLFTRMMITDISAKLGAILFAVVLLATNYGIGVVSFNEMNYQESYAQGPGQKLEFTTFSCGIIRSAFPNQHKQV